VDEEKPTALGWVSNCMLRRSASPVFPSHNTEQLCELTESIPQHKSTGTLYWKSEKKFANY